MGAKISNIFDLDKKKKMIIFAGVLTTTFLSFFESSCVGVIMPKLVRDLNGFGLYSWVFSIYMFTMVLTLPIFGKFTDLYGRKYFFIGGILLFSLGSMLCGFSGSMLFLILSRAVQGVGGGLIAGIAPTVVGDLFPPSERGKYQGFLGGVTGLGTILGPIAGGLLADYISWRWAFFIILPISLVSFFIILKLLPNYKTHTGQKSIDFAGIFFLCLLSGLFILGLNNTYVPDEYKIYLFILMSVLMVVFILVETRAREPIFPVRLFLNPIFSISLGAGFVVGGITYTIMLFAPLLIQGVFGFTAVSTAFFIFPMTLFYIAATVIAGLIVYKTGRYKAVCVTGLLLMAAGLIVLAVNRSNVPPVVIAALALTGGGLGVSFSTFLNVIQNAVPYKELGAATSSNQLFSYLGGIIIVTVLSIVMNGMLLSGLRGVSGFDGKQKVDIQNILKLESAVSGASSGKHEQSILPYRIKSILSGSLNTVFVIAGSIVGGVLIIAAAFLKEIPLRKKHLEEGAEAETAP